MKHLLLLLLLAGLGAAAGCGGSMPPPTQELDAVDGGSDGGPHALRPAVRGQRAVREQPLLHRRQPHLLLAALHDGHRRRPTARCRPPPARATCRATASRSLRRSSRLVTTHLASRAGAREHQRRAAAGLPDRPCTRAPSATTATPQIVMTARELKERGAQTLADALELIPEVQVRQGGMGIRARPARRQAVLGAAAHRRRARRPSPTSASSTSARSPSPTSSRSACSSRPPRRSKGRAATAASSRSSRCARVGASWSTRASSAARRPKARRRSPAASPLGAAATGASAPRSARASPSPTYPVVAHRRQPRAASPTARSRSTARCASSTRPSAAASPATSCTATAPSSFRRRTPPATLLQHITGRGRGARSSLGGEVERSDLRIAARRLRRAALRAPPTSSPTTRSRTSSLPSGSALRALRRRRARRSPVPHRAALAAHALGAPLASTATAPA